MERRIQKRHGIDYEIKHKKMRGSVQEAKYLANRSCKQKNEKSREEVLTEKHKKISRLEWFRPVLCKMNEKDLHQGILL